MSNRGSELFKEALSLPPIERAQLAERLLSSLDSPSRKRVDELWAQESEDRIDAFEKGEIKTITARQVFDEVGKQKAK
ncbi:MAG: addiction module protein [Eubacteriales bacterium]|nr:addiction module protein [Bacillota bacterium]